MRVLLLALAACAAMADVQLQLMNGGKMLMLSNNFVEVLICRMRGRVVSLKGTLVPGNGFSSAPNLVTEQGPLTIGIQTQLSPVAATRSSGNAPLGSLAKIAVHANSSQAASFTLVDIPDDVEAPAATVSTTISLAAGDRAVNVSLATTVTRSANFTSLRAALYFTPDASYWRLADGSMQMGQRLDHPYFASASRYERFYALGANGRGGVDVRTLSSDAAAQPVEPQWAPAPADAPPLPGFSAIFAGHWNGARSGLLHLHAGQALPAEQWESGWRGGDEVVHGLPPQLVSAGTAFASAFRVAPCDVAIPVLDIPADAVAPATTTTTTTNPPSTMDAQDLAAVVMGVFASPAGSIVSHAHRPEGRITPCVFMPNGCYGGTYNYFDPDSYLSIAAILTAGDPYLNAEARKIIDTTRGQLCRVSVAGRCNAGQVPHHIVDSCPGGDPSCVCRPNAVFPDATDCVSFTALSGATQTGPNVFWVLSALTYAARAGDVAWLRTALPDLRLALQPLTGAVDPVTGLLLAPGSLFIDTFNRGNFTTDSNAAMLLVLDAFAEAEEHVAGNATAAAALRRIRSGIASGMQQRLWANATGPAAADAGHFLTQRNPDGTTRDFVDYDANLLAVAAGALDGDAQRTDQVLARVDSGPCTHARGTYVSEVYYNASDCTGGGNYGDSQVTMGRIAVADGWARRRVGTPAAAAVAQARVLDPLRADLLANTWMYERYTCGAIPTHNPYYIEYGETVALLTNNVRYGIDVTLASVTVAPFFPGVLASGFAYRVGAVDIRWSQTAFFAALPLLSGPKTFSVAHTRPGAYLVTVSGPGPVPAAPFKVAVGADGMLRFTAPVGAGYSVSVVHAPGQTADGDREPVHSSTADA